MEAAEVKIALVIVREIMFAKRAELDARRGYCLNTHMQLECDVLYKQLDALKKREAELVSSLS